MNYASLIMITFAPATLPGGCGRNRMALTRAASGR
jgi:hypothetical protein